MLGIHHFIQRKQIQMKIGFVDEKYEESRIEDATDDMHTF